MLPLWLPLWRLCDLYIPSPSSLRRYGDVLQIQRLQVFFKDTDDTDDTGMVWIVLNCIELHWIAISLSYLFMSIPMSVISTLWKLGVLMVLSTQPGTALVTMQTRPKLLATCVAMRHCEPREKMGSMNISVTYPIYYNMIHGGPELCAISSCVSCYILSYGITLYRMKWFRKILYMLQGIVLSVIWFSWIAFITIVSVKYHIILVCVYIYIQVCVCACLLLSSLLWNVRRFGKLSEYRDQCHIPVHCTHRRLSVTPTCRD